MSNEDPLRSPKADLASAYRAVERMKQAGNRDEFEAEWRDFLNCLEKVWVKTERSLQYVRDKFQPWQGKYTNLRRKDMLLRYLKQARDADNHSIQDVMDVTPATLAIHPGPTGVSHIRRITVDGLGNIDVDADGDPRLEITPPKVRAVKVLNSGNWYNPPTSHLGLPVHDDHPLTIAELGLRFYADFLNEAEGYFFQRTP
jgi:hypothetical protein